MSAENSTEEPVKPISGDTAKAPESAKSDKAEQPSTPMPFKEKLCLNVSMIAVVLAVLHVTGLIRGLPTFLTFAVKEQPFATFFVSVFATAFATLVLSSLMPSRINVLGRLPVFAVGGFWLSTAWTSMSESYPATLADTSPVWVLLATMILGLCASWHWDKKASVSERIEVFSWTTLAANIVALCLTFVITALLIANVRGNIEAKIDSEVEFQMRLNYFYVACPEVKSKEYCDALETVMTR